MEVIEGLDVLVLRGSAQDVEQMMEVVRLIERLTQDTEPEIDIRADEAHRMRRPWPPWSRPCTTKFTWRGRAP